MWMNAEDYIPHKRAMRFIDEVCCQPGERRVAVAKVREDNPLLTPKGVPSYVAIEFMAQAIAGQRGITNPEDAEKGGVIVAVKALSNFDGYFAVGSDLDIYLEVLHKDDMFEVNMCEVKCGNTSVSAEITVAELASEE